MQTKLKRFKRSLIEKYHTTVDDTEGKQTGFSQFLELYYKNFDDVSLLDYEKAYLANIASVHYQLFTSWQPGSVSITISDEGNDVSIREGTTWIQVVCNNTQYIVDTIRLVLGRKDYLIKLLIHPIFPVNLQSNRAVLTTEGKSGTPACHVVCVHIEINSKLTETEKEKLVARLIQAIDDVFCVTNDISAMQKQLRDIMEYLSSMPTTSSKQSIQKALDFLSWLLTGHFIFLGYQEINLTLNEENRVGIKATDKSALGICKSNRSITGMDYDDIALANIAVLKKGIPIYLSKSDCISNIYKSSYIDKVSVIYEEKNSREIKIFSFKGFFAETVYMSNPNDIPLVSNKIKWIINKIGRDYGDHKLNILKNILLAYPRDELLQAEAKTILANIKDIQYVKERKSVRVFIRFDEISKFVTCLAFVPKPEFKTSVREEIQDILLKRFNSKRIDYNVSVSESACVQLYFILHANIDSKNEINAKNIEREIEYVTQVWSDKLYSALKTIHQGRCDHYFSTYNSLLPASYIADHTPKEAAFDVGLIDEALRTNIIQLHHNAVGVDIKRFFHLRVYNPKGQMALSEIIPVLENMGLFVHSQIPYEINIPEKQSFWIHDFTLRINNPKALVMPTVFHVSLRHIWDGKYENDRLNNLVILANISVREINVLRAYEKYIRQIDTRYLQSYNYDALIDNAEIANLLVNLFQVKFALYEDRHTAKHLQRKILRYAG